MSKPVFSFNDDVGRQIDDAAFRQQFSVNKRGYYNHHVDPFARTHLFNKAGAHVNIFPKDANATIDEFETKCCNKPTSTVITGKKSETPPLEFSTSLYRDLRTGPNVPAKTTARIGMDDRSGW